MSFTDILNESVHVIAILLSEMHVGPPIFLGGVFKQSVSRKSMAIARVKATVLV